MTLEFRNADEREMWINIWRGAIANQKLLIPTDVADGFITDLRERDTKLEKERE